MLILRDFKCEDCGEEFEDLTHETKTGCLACNGNAYMVIRKIALQGVDFFEPHYDQQVGQWFESADHKKKVLESVGRVQISGSKSPKGSSKMRLKMTKDQARKFDPFMESSLKQHQAKAKADAKKN